MLNIAHDNNLMSAPESSHQKKRSADQKIAQTGVGLSTTCGRWITAILLCRNALHAAAVNPI